MSLADLLPELHALPRADKLRAIQVLAAELAKEEDVYPLRADVVYPIYTPYGCDDAAEILQRLLEAERKPS